MHTLLGYSIVHLRRRRAQRVLWIGSSVYDHRATPTWCIRTAVPARQRQHYPTIIQERWRPRGRNDICFVYGVIRRTDNNEIVKTGHFSSLQCWKRIINPACCSLNTQFRWFLCVYRSFPTLPIFSNINSISRRSITTLDWATLRLWLSPKPVQLIRATLTNSTRLSSQSVRNENWNSKAQSRSLNVARTMLKTSYIEIENLVKNDMHSNAIHFINSNI